jgi:hypothetical protein
VVTPFVKITQDHLCSGFDFHIIVSFSITVLLRISESIPYNDFQTRYVFSLKLNTDLALLRNFRYDSDGHNKCNIPSPPSPHSIPKVAIIAVSVVVPVLLLVILLLVYFICRERRRKSNNGLHPIFLSYIIGIHSIPKYLMH